MTTIRCLSVLLCASIAFGYTGVASVASEPSIYSKMLTPSPLGNDRILVLCLSEQGDNKILTRFYDSLIWNEFSERHLTVVEVSRRAVQSVFVDNNDNAQGATNRARHQDYGDKLRRKADCKNNFEFVLIGKDTGVKQRWKNDFSQKELFNLIDAMPMRRYEMRQQADKN